MNGRMLLVGASCWLLVVVGTCEELTEEEERSLEDDIINTREEKELIEALQEVLQKLRNKQVPSSEKKLGLVPMCHAGDQCAVRKGARIGRMCGCPRGTACDYGVFQCL